MYPDSIVELTISHPCCDLVCESCCCGQWAWLRSREYGCHVRCSRSAMAKDARNHGHVRIGPLAMNTCLSVCSSPSFPPTVQRELVESMDSETAVDVASSMTEQGFARRRWKWRIVYLHQGIFAIVAVKKVWYKHHVESNWRWVSCWQYRFRSPRTGHWIQNCPTNDDPEFEGRPRIKRTTGIPKSFLQKVESTLVQGKSVMVTADGSFVIARPDEWALFDKLIKLLMIGLNRNIIVQRFLEKAQIGGSKKPVCCRYSKPSSLRSRFSLLNLFHVIEIGGEDFMLSISLLPWLYHQLLKRAFIGLSGMRIEGFNQPIQVFDWGWRTTDEESWIRRRLVAC